MAKQSKSRDQKRKAKKAKKAGQSRKGESLAYRGDKYKVDDLAGLWMETEIAIYEVYVMTDRTLTDRTVHSAVESLVKKLRAATLPPFTDDSAVVFDHEHLEEFLIDNIRRHWEQYFESRSAPPDSDGIGVLRSILGMIELKKVREPHSQRYLKYIAEFLTKKAGVSVDLIPSDKSQTKEENLPTLGNLRP